MSGIAERFTAKVGPLPVWAWALVILVGGYLVYRFTAGKSSSSSSPDTAAPPSPATDGDTTPVGSDTGNPVGGGGGGGAADNLNGDLYSYLTGLQGSVDALTASIQLSPGFWPGSETGTAGSGSGVPNGTTPAAPGKKQAPPPKAKPPAGPIKYYTYAPGKTPKGQPKTNEAPARGPAGTTLKFKPGKGYYYG